MSSGPYSCLLAFNSSFPSHLHSERQSSVMAEGQTKSSRKQSLPQSQKPQQSSCISLVLNQSQLPEKESSDGLSPPDIEPFQWKLGRRFPREFGVWSPNNWFWVAKKIKYITKIIFIKEIYKLKWDAQSFTTSFLKVKPMGLFTWVDFSD